MKKLLLLVALFTTIYATKANAQQQGGGDPAAMMQRMKERIKPALIEKIKITDAQADKVIEVYFNNQRKRRDVRTDQSLSDEDRTKKNNEIEEAQNKDLKAIPLTEEQVKEVNAFFDDMRKQQMQRRQNGGGGN
jgi:Spy/CpxP family protein refolding chaperone